MSAGPTPPHRHHKPRAAALRWVVVAVYFSFFTLLLLLPNPTWLFAGLGGSGGAWWDFGYGASISYAVHFVGFGLLVLLLIWASPVRGRARYVWPAVLVVLYGTLVEIVQIPIPTRAFEVLDLVANSAGCVVAAGLSSLVWSAPTARRS